MAVQTGSGVPKTGIWYRKVQDGKFELWDGSVRIEDIDTDQRAKVTVNGLQVYIDETLPTDPSKNNPPLTLTWDASGNLTNIAPVIGGVTYNKVFTWTDGNLTDISAWS